MITTEIDKHKIKSSFSKAALKYDTFASLQKEVAEELINFVFKTPHPTSHIPHPGILDIGCGTGFLSHNLAELFPEASILGCDISHSMIKVARGKNNGGQESGVGGQNKKIYFLTADGSVFPYKNETFDIAASNLTYQWIGNLEGSFREAYRVLKDDGVFVFSTLGPDTLKELRACYAEASGRFNKNGLPPFLQFYGKDSIHAIMKDAGLREITIEPENKIKTYPDMWALLKTLKAIGAGNPLKDGDKSLARGSILKKMAEIYKDRFKIQDSRFKSCSLHLATCNCIYATYEVMFVKAFKL